MNFVAVGSWISIAVLTFASLFQVALIFGAPWGEYALGGINKGRLSRNLRIASFVSLMVYLAVIGHYLSQVGVLNPLLDSSGNSLVNWAIVGLMSLSLIANLASRSKKERNLWAPIVLVLLISSLAVAIN
jgi:hypothetical protein